MREKLEHYVISLHKEGYSNLQILELAKNSNIELGQNQITHFLKKNGLKSNRYLKISEDLNLKQFLLGSLLGDGCLCKIEGNVKTSRLSFGHSVEQEFYINWKHSFLKDYNLVTGKVNKYTSFSERYLSGQCTSFFMKSVSHPYFSKFRELFYINNKKTISQKVFKELEDLNALGLAIWYMDDGYLWKQANRLPKSRFCTTGFDVDSINNLILMLKNNFGIDSKLYYDNEICINTDSMSKFIEIIKPHILEEFKYKLP